MVRSKGLSLFFLLPWHMQIQYFQPHLPENKRLLFSLGESCRASRGGGGPQRAAAQGLAARLSSGLAPPGPLPPPVLGAGWPVTCRVPGLLKRHWVPTSTIHDPPHPRACPCPSVHFLEGHRSDRARAHPQNLAQLLTSVVTAFPNKATL